MPSLATLDQKYVWHPFTQMRDWLRRKPLVITEGRGAVLRDAKGREYLDANSSIWTNLHGHGHPRINAALRRQLGKIAHSSALGLANEPAARLAARLISTAATQYAPEDHRPGPAKTLDSSLKKVFFSDDGSTALEVALKLAYEFTRRTWGPKVRPRFLSLDGAYHGDTIGAVSLGHIDLFHKAYGGMLFPTDKVMSPYCYRCPFNRAKPQREDARKYRQCHWECVDQLETKFRTRSKSGNRIAAFVFEPLMQGAAGMIAQPSGWLTKTTEIARGHGALLIADEVMTGFGRTGIACHLDDEIATRAIRKPGTSKLFATARAGVTPDFLCLAKGLTGGYLPMAATLTTQRVFDAFLGEYEEFKTFFHGHSYTGNQLGAAAGLASLAILQSSNSVRARARLQQNLRDELKDLWQLPVVGDIRQVGLVAGIELVKDWKNREPFALADKAGIRVCEALARRGVLTRPVGNVIVLMPPYCTTERQLRKMVAALYAAIEETFPHRPGEKSKAPK
jgi:adenosylmethionine-8-amino-7-oxononanoate aminotransferase